MTTVLLVEDDPAAREGLELALRRLGYGVRCAVTGEAALDGLSGAAAVSLIRGVRAGMFEAETNRITQMLLKDDDLMVQKGLGWLLREAAKYNRQFAVPLLMKIRKKSPRLVLRTACETLPMKLRAEILGQTAKPLARAASK